MKITSQIKHSITDIIIISVCCLLFLLLGMVAIDYDFYAYAFLPVVVLGIIFIIHKLYYSVFLIAFLTPLSVIFRNESFSITVPTEPMLIIVMLLFLWDVFFNKNYDKKALQNPITTLIFVNLSWMLVAALFSWDIIISLKYILSRLWFIIPCYFMMLPIFKDKKTIRWFVLAYGFALSIIIIYCSVKFANLGFSFAEMNQIPSPFYNDHTDYGAAIGLFIPITLYFLFGNKNICPNKYYRIVFIFITICLLIGFVLSYARATWVSVLCALGVFIIIKLRIKLKTIITTSLIIGVLGLLSFTTIVQMLESNSQDSSGDLSKHVTSISNISTDASNMERINRWACAIRMFKEKPIIGWGPGTYQFVYGSYQRFSQRTIISTNEGTMGNAHSEYIGPLSEQGIIGCLIVIVMFGTTIYIGINTYKTSQNKQTANMSLFITLSLITYYAHGFMNNFLDTDKLSVPVWAFMAMVSSLYISNKEEEQYYRKEINSITN